MKVPERVLKAITLGAIVGASALVAFFEGKSNTPYEDIVGVRTVCYGHTGRDIRDDTYSNAECEAILQVDIDKANDVLNKYVTVPLSDSQRIALLSFIINVGEGSFKGSTLLRKLNRGDYLGACNELPRWVYAGGKTVKGLVTRREIEQIVCLGELNVLYDSD